MADQATPVPDSADSGAVTYCGHCGEPTNTGNHDTCATRLELEPPRFCAHCRRRMIVQVVPRGWRARCTEHGALASGIISSLS